MLGMVFLIGLTGPGWSASYPTATAPATGDGSSGNPYRIATLENLYWITAPEVVVASPTQATRWAAHYIQTADIDASDTNGGTGWGTAGWSPIGNSTTKFTGSYGGAGYTIDNLFINQSSTTYVGLFGYTDGATVGDLGVTNVNITGGDYTGGLIGYGSGSTIYNCHSTGGISGSRYVGGLIGANALLVTSCYSNCTVSGASGCDHLGGLIGYNPSKVSNCYATGSVNGDGNGFSSEFAGLIGLPGSGTTTDCYSTGSVSGTNAYLSGCIGSLYGATATNCFWDTETSGRASSGGGTGKTTAQMKTLSTFTGVGWDFEGETANGTKDFWDIDGSTNNGYPFLLMIINFESVSAVAPSGNGESGTPYQIATLDNLYWISQNSSEWNKQYVQTADINALSTYILGGGNGFTPIGNGTTKFTGAYDGAGYTIDELFIDQASTSYVGLFGYANGATIMNVGLTNVDMTGDNYAGGLTGYGAGSTISCCYSTGRVHGNGNVGGLIGASASSVTRCYSNCNVGGSSGCNNLGGLIGYNPSDVSNCYATGSVNGDGNGFSSEFAGLIGLPGSGTTTDCYSTGSVSGTNAYLSGCIGSLYGATATNCFWDTETSGRALSGGGTGKTTAEMTSVATFTDESTAGLTTAWDFETNPNDDVANDNYWDMDLSGTINGGYPFLSYQNSTDCSLPVELAVFTAEVTDKGDVLLQWITESEIENLGFNLYRSSSQNGDYQRINSAMIPGAGSSPDRHTYSYTDKKPGAGHILWYQLEDVDFTGKSTKHTPVSIVLMAKAFPTEFCLHPNYPNPFNPVTQFTYEIPETRDVHIAIYGISGAKVCDLFKGKQEPGAYTLRWDGTDTSGGVLPSGIYFVVIQAGSDYDKFKMTLLR